MKKTLPIVCLIFMVSILSACEESPPPADAPETARVNPETPEVMAPPSDLPYALRSADNSWPGGEAPAQLAEDWLAANYYLVLDGSGSMARRECTGDSHGNKMAVAKQAVAAFIEQIPPQAHVALFVFDARGVSERVGFAQSDRNALQQAIAAIEPDGYTPLLTAINHAYTALRTQAAKQLGYGEYHLVVITDGLASSGEDPTPVVTQILRESPVVLHTIGFCIDDQHPLNQPGRSYYTSANSPDELRRGLQAILAEAPDFTPGAF